MTDTIKTLIDDHAWQRDPADSHGACKVCKASATKHLAWLTKHNRYLNPLRFTVLKRRKAPNVKASA